MSSEEKHNWIRERIIKGFNKAVDKAIERTRYSEHPYMVVSRNGKVQVVKLERETK